MEYDLEKENKRLAEENEKLKAAIAEIQQKIKEKRDAA